MYTFFIMRILNKHEFQQIAINHLSDINSKGFINIFRKMNNKIIIFFSDSFLGNHLN